MQSAEVIANFIENTKMEPPKVTDKDLEKKEKVFVSDPEKAFERVKRLWVYYLFDLYPIFLKHHIEIYSLVILWIKKRIKIKKSYKIKNQFQFQVPLLDCLAIH